MQTANLLQMSTVTPTPFARVARSASQANFLAFLATALSPTGNIVPSVVSAKTPTSDASAPGDAMPNPMFPRSSEKKPDSNPSRRNTSKEKSQGKDEQLSIDLERPIKNESEVTESSVEPDEPRIEEGIAADPVSPVLFLAQRISVEETETPLWLPDHLSPPDVQDLAPAPAVLPILSVDTRVQTAIEYLDAHSKIDPHVESPAPALLIVPENLVAESSSTSVTDILEQIAAEWKKLEHGDVPAKTTPDATQEPTTIAKLAVAAYASTSRPDKPLETPTVAMNREKQQILQTPPLAQGGHVEMAAAPTQNSGASPLSSTNSVRSAPNNGADHADNAGIIPYGKPSLLGETLNAMPVAKTDAGEVAPATKLVSGDAGRLAPMLAAQQPRGEQRLLNDRLESNATLLAQSDRAELVNRLQNALASAFARMPDSLEVELSPPSLGAIRVRVERERDVLVARVETNQGVVAGFLSDNARPLLESLAKQGIPLNAIHWSLANNSAGNLGGRDQHDRTGDRHYQPPAPTVARMPKAEAAPVQVTTLWRLGSSVDRLI